MPGLDTDLHLRMLNKSNPAKRGGIYGLEWGDPDKVGYLRQVKRYYLDYYIHPSATVVEIGPGGGRWTRYMLDAARIYAVDYHQELLDELRATYPNPNITFIRNTGTDFPGIPDHSVDFVFSFGVFVHLEIDLIDAYLANMRRLLKPTSNVVIQYSDKTKPAAQRNRVFSENRPATMIALAQKHGFHVEDDNRWLLHHSSILRLTLETDGVDSLPG